MDNNLFNIKKSLDSLLEKNKKNMATQSSEFGYAVSQEINKLAPLLQDIADAVKENTAVTKELEMTPDIHVEAPIVNVPDIHVPEPRVHVNVPETKFPKFPEFPKIPEYPKQKEYDWKNPLPVLLTDIEGRPYTAGYVGGSGGGMKAISDIQQLAGYPISVNSGITDNGTLRVTIPTDAGVSVNIISSSGSLATALVDSSGVQYSGSNPLPVTFGSPIGQGDGASALRTIQAGDSVSSVSIVSNIATLDVQMVSGSVSSINLLQVGGNAVVVGSGFQDNALRVVNATDAVTSVSIAGNIAALDVKQVSGDVSSTVINSIVSPIGQGDTASALRVVHAGDSAVSMFITGSADSMMVLMARTTNPTAVVDGADVRGTADKLGRTLYTPVQVRQLRNTAYVALSTGTEATLLASGASTFNDLIYITGANNSGAAVAVDVRSETAAGIMLTLNVPANGTAGVAFPAPLPQNTAAGTWTVDMPDITGTTVWISALFSQEL